jgi:hypothetical protein
MPTWRITAPRNYGRIKKGTSFTVVSRTTAGHPEATDIEEVLRTNGYTEHGEISWRSSGNWDYVKLNDDTYPAWWEQHDAYEKVVKSNKHNDSPTSSNSGNNSGGGKEVNPVSGNKKLVALAGLFAVAAACSPSKDASGTSSPGKKVLPKPKVAVSRPSTSATSSTGKKSLISTTRLSGISSNRPLATSKRASILSSVKSSSKSGGILGGLKKSTSLGGSKVGKKSSILGGTTRKSSVGGSVTSKKSSSMFGTSSKSSTSSTKSGGLLGGTSKKSTSSTKSGGLFGGSSKKSGGLGLGKKRR